MDKRTKEALLDAFGLLLSIASSTMLVVGVFSPEILATNMPPIRMAAVMAVSAFLFVVSFSIVTRKR